MLSPWRVLRIRGHTIWPPGLNSNSIVIDAGAHHGEFSSAIIQRFGSRCYLVEANPDLAATLSHPNYKAVIAAALASEDGKAVFWHRANLESGSILPRPREERATTAEVETITLASLMYRNSLKGVDLLKLDIEGAEFDFLNSAPEEVLHSIGQITVEFHDFLAEFSRAGLYKTVQRRLSGLGFLTCCMSFRTHGDVLFINTRIFPLGLATRLWLKHGARWLTTVKTRKCAI